MNTLQQQLLDDLATLPESMQAEALNFVQFLKTRLERSGQPQIAAANSPHTHQPNGAAIVRIMERMAARNALSGIKDPSAWQREIRKDRPLPGRD